MFTIHSYDVGKVAPFENLPAGAITPKIGMALVQDGGGLVAAAGTEKPTYICMCERASEAAEGEPIPVVRVLPDIVFGTTCAVDFAGVKVGDKVSITEDGLRVNAAAGGAAEVVAIDGTDAGSEIRVRFV